MVGSAGDADQTIRRARAVVLVAVVGLLAVALFSNPGTVLLVVAGVAAVAAAVAMWAVGRTAGAGDGSSPAGAIETAPVDGTGDPADRRSDSEAVSRFVVSLARRNGGLVDQQLALLDTLEASVEDPTLLSNYFKLDHLATRMRRNADSLLVLAGVDRPGLRAPQDIDEVVRAGISEIEDYRRIDVLALDHVQVTGSAATTLGHLVAELLDNATSFSPPDTRVRVAGNSSDTGYEILVADSGIGIAETRIDDLNQRLASPPASGVVQDESIGLTVVAMLAARIGAGVTLARSEHGGTVATVHVPSAVLHHGAPHEHAPSTPRPIERVPPRVDASPPAPVPAAASSLAMHAGPPEAEISTEGLQAASAAAIAKLTLTVAGLPVRTTPTISSDDFLPSRVRMAIGPGDDTGSWPPPVGNSRADSGFAPPAPLRTALGPLQVAESAERRPVVEAQPARIGAALASFARQSVPAWEPVTSPDGGAS